jgi:hypothetical protein
VGGDGLRVVSEGDRLLDGPHPRGVVAKPRSRSPSTCRISPDHCGSRVLAAQSSAAFFEQTRAVSSVYSIRQSVVTA